MPFMWKITIDDYLEICERAMTKGIKPGEPMEKVALEYMKEKGKKSLGATDLTIEELMKDAKEKGINSMAIEHDKEGKQKIKCFKKNKEK